MTSQDHDEAHTSTSQTSSLASAPAAIIHTASSLLPSFLHPAPSSKDEKEDHISKTSTPRPTELPPNPLIQSSDSPERKHHAETMKHYVRDHKRRALKRLSTSEGGADSELPKVKQGEGEPPNIIYKDGEWPGRCRCRCG